MKVTINGKKEQVYYPMRGWGLMLDESWKGRLYRWVLFNYLV